MTFNPYGEWEEYQNIEEDFLRYLRNVPLVEDHYDVWSFPLSNFLINIGSLVDSFFKNVAQEPSMRHVPEIESITRAPSQANMSKYKAVFEPHHLLSTRKVFEVRNYSAIIPFANWSTVNRRATTPTWWKAYTDLKHDRFQNKEKATLKNVLDALAALFLLNVKSVETINVLLDYRIIDTGRYGIESVKRAMSLKEPFNIASGPTLHAKTGLFGYVYDNSTPPLSDEVKIRVLSPSYRERA